MRSATGCSCSVTTTSATRSSHFADVTGDSFKLARDAAAPAGCRVHRLLRRALHGRVGRHPHRRQPAVVILPDLAAGCSMADMAGYQQVRDAWDALTDAGRRRSHGSGHLHELDGRHQRVHRCAWRHRVHVVECRARAATGRSQRGEKVLFLPDQHLGRNTAVLELGLSLSDCVVFDPHTSRRWPVRRSAAGCDHDPLAGALLGARPVHAGERRRGTRPHPRRQHSGAPSAGTTSSQKADVVGLDRDHHPARSTPPRPGRRGRSAPSSTWSQRLADRHPDKQIVLPREDGLLLLDA